MHVPRTGTQAARVRSVVFVVFRDGAESERSSGDGTCQAPPSLMRSYCQLGVCRDAELCSGPMCLDVGPLGGSLGGREEAATLKQPVRS